MQFLVTGAGSIAKRHVQNLARLGLPSRIVVVTRHPNERTKDWAVAPGILQTVDSFEEGLTCAPNAVIIASASTHHGRELGEVLDRQLPVLVEKPLLTKLSDWAAIEPRLSRAHPASVLGCNLRYLPALHRLREALATGIAGRLVRAHLEVGQWLPDWRPTRDATQSYSASPSTGGGVVFDLVHEIDMALWLMGDLQLVGAVGGQLSSLSITADDTAVALLRSRNGTAVTVSLDYVSRAPIRRYVFVGDLGTLVFDLHARRLSLRTALKDETLCEDALAFDVGTTYQTELNEWIHAIRNGTPVWVSPLSDGVGTTRLMLQMNDEMTRSALPQRPTP